MIWLEPGRDPEWDIAHSIRHSFRRNMKILAGEYPKPYAVFVSQWQIPKYETGAPGHGALRGGDPAGEVDVMTLGRKAIEPLFVRRQHS